MMNKLTYLWFLAVILGAKSGLAPFITPCKNGDNVCILASAQKAVPIMAVGIPELGVPSLDPMHFDEIVGDQGGLTLNFKDTTVTGMKGCHAEAIKHDLKKGKQSLTIRCTVELSGNYKLGGQLIVLPIQGQGQYSIYIRDIIIKATTSLVTVNGDDGKKHWHIDKWHYTSQTKSGATFTFDNLFNGNRLLAAPIEEFVNTNWRDVMNEVAPPIVKAIVGRTVEAVEALYKAVPAEELFIE